MTAGQAPPAEGIMTDSYIVHLDHADVTEILGALDTKISAALDRVVSCRALHVEPNAAWWLTRARAMAAVAERIAVELWGSSAQWLSPDVLRRLDEAEAATPEDSRTTLAVR